MDPSRFGSQKTGQLVSISTPTGADWAFVPDPLPPQWEFPDRLWPILSDAREALARLDEKGKTVQNPTLLLTPLQRREALRSSSLEGTFATPKELLLYEMSPKPPKSKSDRTVDSQEVSNYNAALHHGYKKLSDPGPTGLPLSLRLIQEMHRELLGGVRGNDKSPGEFRTRQVHVGSDRRYIPPPPGEPLQQSLQNIQAYMHEHGTRFHPLVLSYLVHYQFEAIHPFLDGNGRVGRALLSLTTYKWCDLSLPWLYMSAFFERYKDEYIDNLFRVSTHGDWDRWIEFCLRGTVDQCDDAIARCDRLDKLRRHMHDKADHLSPRMHLLIERLFHLPVFEVSWLAERLGVTKPTIRADVQKLIDAGFVQHMEGERPKVYWAPPIFVAAYSEENE